MAIFKNKDSSRGDEQQPAGELAPSTHPNGEQSVDKAEDKVLPDSKPDEIAPVPDADGSAPKGPKPKPSATGFRVAAGKSISGARGDLLDAGAEIGPADVAGGSERLGELVKAGYLVETEKSSDEPERPVSKSDEKSAADKVVEKLADALGASKK